MDKRRFRVNEASLCSELVQEPPASELFTRRSLLFRHFNNENNSESNFLCVSANKSLNVAHRGAFVSTLAGADVQKQHLQLGQQNLRLHSNKPLASCCFGPQHRVQSDGPEPDGFVSTLQHLRPGPRQQGAGNTSSLK